MLIKIIIIISASIIGSLILIMPKSSFAFTPGPGDLIKAQDYPAVYYFGSDNKRHPFSNEVTYFTWYPDFSTIKTISLDELTAIPLGSNITVRPCTKLVKLSKDSKVYLVEPSGVLRWIPSEGQVRALHGSNWQVRVFEIPEVSWPDYTLGSSLTSSQPANGCLVKYLSSPDVYLISNGLKRKIKDEATFLANHYKWYDVITIQHSVTYSDGSVITGAEVELIDITKNARATPVVQPTVPTVPSVPALPSPTPSPTSVSSQTFAVGTYLVCKQWQAFCDYEKGIEQIKEIGGSVALVSVGGSELMYNSEYLPRPDWLAEETAETHLKNIVEYAHGQGLKIYAWWSMPHDYWLEQHPGWLSVSSEGQPITHWKIIPPSRVLSTPEYLAVMKGVIGELVDLGFDGIDINDNFQFLDNASFDDFTVHKFEQEAGVVVLGDAIPERAQYIWNNLSEEWYRWRADQTTEFLRLMQQYIDDAGSDIPLRPHLMSSGEWAYYGWAYDWQEIGQVVDMPYVMFGFGTEAEMKDEIGWLKEGGAGKIAASLYLDTIEIGGEEKLGQAMRWIKEAGVNEVFLFTWILAEEKNLWETIKKAVEIANQ